MDFSASESSDFDDVIHVKEAAEDAVPEQVNAPMQEEADDVEAIQKVETGIQAPIQTELTLSSIDA